MGALRVLCITGVNSISIRVYSRDVRVHSRLNFLVASRLEKAEMIQTVLEFYVYPSGSITA